MSMSPETRLSVPSASSSHISHELAPSSELHLAQLERPALVDVVGRAAAGVEVVRGLGRTARRGHVELAATDHEAVGADVDHRSRLEQVVPLRRQRHSGAGRHVRIGRARLAVPLLPALVVALEHPLSG